MEAIAIRMEQLPPLLLGWRSLLLGWRPLLLAMDLQLLLQWRSIARLGQLPRMEAIAISNGLQLLLGWRSLLLGWPP